MSSFKIKLKVLGSVATNCYLLYQEETKEAILFDPADEADVIKQMIEESGLQLKAIFLTHGHYDHIAAIKELKKIYSVPVYGSSKEEEVVSNPEYNLSIYIGGDHYAIHLDKTLEDGETVDAAGFHIRVILTPGHTKGSVCYYLAEEKLLFSGDTLFACSVGRSDFPTGSASVLIRSVQEKLMILPEDVKVFPGHGEQTSIHFEKQHNPFIVV